MDLLSLLGGSVILYMLYRAYQLINGTKVDTSRISDLDTKADSKLKELKELEDLLNSATKSKTPEEDRIVTGKQIF